jgi:hypothetical protein
MMYDLFIDYNGSNNSASPTNLYTLGSTLYYAVTDGRSGIEPFKYVPCIYQYSFVFKSV